MDSEAIQDVFHALGPVRVRRMFGGYGIYRDGLMFALAAGGELYLKTDAATVALFRDLGSRPFTYASRNGRTTSLSYWLMPESAFEDEGEAERLARLALEAARRASAKSRDKDKPGAAGRHRGTA